MRMRFASLGSGSKGNSTVICDGSTCLLVDLGFTLKETLHRLRRLGVEPEQIDGLVVTHEHADHFHGVAPFARRFGVPVYLTHGTHKSLSLVPAFHKISCHESFTLGTMEITPVPVPHDAREPCQYLVKSAGLTIGILTDLGHITPHVRASYKNCDALLLECNHDLDMLRQGPYPYRLKMRVGGDYGHLNNTQAADLLAGVDLPRLQHLVISHISQKNNHPEKARQAITPLLTDWNGTLTLADQQAGFDWLSL